MQNILKVEKVQESIVRLIMGDEKTGNSLSDQMISTLSSSIKEITADKSIKVIIISSEGKIFCSGHNLKDITVARKNNDQGESYFMDLFESCSVLMQLIVNCPKPIIAEVNGIATAAGCQLVASCDLAISSNTAKFATPGVNIGLFCSTPMVALSRNVSKKEAMKMLLTGDMIDAVEAKRISLINDYVSEDKLEESVNNLALKISKKSSMTVKIGKEAFYKQAEMSLSDAYAYTSVVMAQNTLNDDAKEGISSFIEKRDPNWQDN